MTEPKHSAAQTRNISSLPPPDIDDIISQSNRAYVTTHSVSGVDLVPEDEVESGSEIYYFTDEDGNIRSREFLAEELISDDVAEDSLKRKPEHEKVQLQNLHCRLPKTN